MVLKYVLREIWFVLTYISEFFKFTLQNNQMNDFLYLNFMNYNMFLYYLDVCTVTRYYKKI